MTTQKLQNRYVFADRESITAEQMRRRGLERFLGSQMLIAAAFGLDAIDAAAAATKDGEDLRPPTSTSEEATREDASDARFAMQSLDEPDQPGEAESRAAASEPGDTASGVHDVKSQTMTDQARNVPSTEAPATAAGGDDPRLDAQAPADVSDFVDMGVDIARLIDIGEGPSLVVAAEINAPLLPDIGVSLGLFAGDGDQIRLDADVGLISIHASAGLPLVADVTSLLGETAESTITPTLATITQAATPVVEQLANVGALADLGTIVITGVLPTNDDPMFEGPAHTSYAMALNVDALAPDALLFPLATSLVENDVVSVMSADSDQQDAGLQSVSSLALLTH